MTCGAPSHERFLQCQSIVTWDFVTEIQHRLEQKAPDKNNPTQKCILHTGIYVLRNTYLYIIKREKLYDTLKKALFTCSTNPL